MARIIDITDKLVFDENPRLVIKGKELEVNGDAPTMLKVMALMSGDDPGMDEIGKAYGLLFPEKAREAIDALKLSVPSWMVLVQEAVSLIMGEADSRGEH